MMRYIRLGILTLTTAIIFLAVSNSSPLIYAEGSASGSQACSGLNQVTGTQSCDTSNTSGSTLYSIINKIVNTLSWVVGIITVIMVIVAGFQFITSGGDSNGVSKAKTALFYAMIGLFIVALAQFLVHFVLSSVSA